MSDQQAAGATGWHVYEEGELPLEACLATSSP